MMTEKKHDPQSVGCAPRAVAFSIRNMEWDDLPRLASMGESDRHPWTYQDLARAMDSPYALGVVAETQKQVVGYLIYVVSNSTSDAGRKQNRIHLTVGILNLVTAGEWRRKGAGRFLLDSVESGLVKQFSRECPQGRIKLAATVPETWLDVQLFLKSCGFAVPLLEGKPRVGPVAPIHLDLSAGPTDGYVFERRSEWPR